MRILSALVSFLHSSVISHLAQALATSMLSANKNRCGMGAREEPLVAPERTRSNEGTRQNTVKLGPQQHTAAEFDHNNTGVKSQEDEDEVVKEERGEESAVAPWYPTIHNNRRKEAPVQ